LISIFQNHGWANLMIFFISIFGFSPLIYAPFFQENQPKLWEV
jgi:hypothetical protein